MFLGMDVDGATAFAEQLRTGGERISGELSTLDEAVLRSEAFWRGPDAEAFRSSWSQMYRSIGLETVSRVDRSADTVAQNVEEQETASTPDGEAGAGAGVPGGTAGGQDDGTRYSIPRGPADDSGPLVNDEVAAAWNEMSTKEKREVAQEIVDTEFEKYGMDPVTLQVEDKDEFSGGWTEAEKKLTITEAWLEHPSSTAVFAHEVRHAAQSEFARDTDPTGFLWWKDDKSSEYAELEKDYGVTREDITQLKENMPEYGGEYHRPPEDPGPSATEAERKVYERERYEYEYQPLELDARTVGDGFSRGLELDDLRAYQERAGVEQAGPPVS